MRAESGAGVVVGRRPIVDAELQVHGQRLVVAGGDGEVALSAAVAERLADAGGLGRVFSTRTAFVRPSRGFFVGEEQVPGLPDRSVVMVDSAAAWDRSVVEGCRRLARAGWKLAVAHPGKVLASGGLRRIASYVCLDMRVVAREGPRRRAGPAEPHDLPEMVARAGRGGATVVALNVDTPAQFAEARAAGFELFQGRFLSSHAAVVNEALTPSRMACLAVLEKVNDPDTSAGDLERVVESDPALSYRLLHVSGLGADGGLRRPVRSVREAAVLLGRDYINRWLVLMLMADANEGAPEQLLIAVTRARMCELIAEATHPAERNAAFTVGLLSALPLLLGAPLDEVVVKLAIHEDLKRALLHRSGWLGEALSDVLDWEAGSPPATLRSGLDRFAAEGLYLEALGWAGGLEESLLTAA